MSRRLIALLGGLALSAQAEVLLEGANTEGWQVEAFVGETQYRAVQDPVYGPVLEGVAQGTASGLGLETTIRPDETPTLAWRWQVLERPDVGQSEQTKATDDFPARVYVLREGRFGLLSTKSLVYVWSQTQPAGSVWDSPYTGRVKMMAVQPAASQSGWVEVRRNLAEDWQRAFGDELDKLDAVALMVDADNTNTRARAQFESIWLEP